MRSFTVPQGRFVGVYRHRDDGRFDLVMTVNTDVADNSAKVVGLNRCVTAAYVHGLLALGSDVGLQGFQSRDEIVDILDRPPHLLVSRRPHAPAPRS